jgi:hypothetical protein
MIGDEIEDGAVGSNLIIEAPGPSPNIVQRRAALIAAVSSNDMMSFLIKYSLAGK